MGKEIEIQEDNNLKLPVMPRIGVSLLITCPVAIMFYRYISSFNPQPVGDIVVTVALGIVSFGIAMTALSLFSLIKLKPSKNYLIKKNLSGTYSAICYKLGTYYDAISTDVIMTNARFDTPEEASIAYEEAYRAWKDSRKKSKRENSFVYRGKIS